MSWSCDELTGSLLESIHQILKLCNVAVQQPTNFRIPGPQSSTNVEVVEGNSRTKIQVTLISRLASMQACHILL